jgi:hypothetical protein
MKLEVGKTYQTFKSGPVTIVEDLGSGRKRFVGKLSDGQVVYYFRNGSYSNASRVKGGHPHDIIENVKPALQQPA